MKRAYTLYVCPRCDEHYIYAGACDDDGAKLIARRMIPISVVEDFRDSYVSSSSPVPAWFIEHFVKGLLEFAGYQKKSSEELPSDP